MHGYSQFSFWIPVALGKISFPRIVINRSKISCYYIKLKAPRSTNFHVCCTLVESQSQYFTMLKNLIEETYSANGKKKITLMSHSLGCPYTLVFLNNQTKDWKDKYILQWITLSGHCRNKALIRYFNSFFFSGRDALR